MCVCVRVNLQYLRQYVSYYIQTWHKGRRMDPLYDNVRFDDIDVDARPQWVGKDKQIASATKQQQAISIKLATIVGHFFR